MGAGMYRQVFVFKRKKIENIDNLLVATRRARLTGFLGCRGWFRAQFGRKIAAASHVLKRDDLI
jgi:hypothetical protein